MFIWGPFTSVIGSFLKRILFHCIQIFFSFLIKPSFPFFLFCKSITISFVISGWKLAGGRVSDFSFSPFFNVLNLVHSPEILPSQSSLILSHLCWIGGHLYSRLKQGWGLASCSSKTLSMCQSWQEETVAPSASLWEASSYVYVWNHRVFQILESPMTEQVLPLTNWTRCFIAAVLMVCLLSFLLTLNFKAPSIYSLPSRSFQNMCKYIPFSLLGMIPYYVQLNMNT